MYVPSTCNVHPRSTFFRLRRDALSSSANVPSLLSLAQKFTNLEDPTFNFFTPLALAASAAHCRPPKGIVPSHNGYRSTKFEPNPSNDLACSLGKIKGDENFVHDSNTCNVHSTSTFYIAS